LDEFSCVPPRLSPYDQPRDYNYKPGDHKILEQRRNQASQKGRRLLFDFDSETLPAIEALDPDLVNHPDTEQLKRLFQERPIWSAKALFLSLKGYSDVNTVLRILMGICYRFHSGPWRHIYIRRGYDPRQSPESRFYQILDFRIEPSEARKLGITVVEDLDSDISARLRAQLKRNLSKARRLKNPQRTLVPLSHIKYAAASYDEVHFTGPPVRMMTIYQLCDIDSDQVQRIVLNASVQPECYPSTGWLSAEDLNEIRRAMKLRVDMWNRDKVLPGDHVPEQTLQLPSIESIPFDTLFPDEFDDEDQEFEIFE
jgi:hypothetical protein